MRMVVPVNCGGVQVRKGVARKSAMRGRDASFKTLARKIGPPNPPNSLGADPASAND